MIFKIFTLILFILAIHFIQCNTNTSPLYPYGTIDKNLIGDWYYKESRSIIGSPPEYISGIKISENGYIYELAVEWSSGKLSFFSDNPIGTVLNAINGNIEIKIYRQGMLVESNYNFGYQIIDGQLLFKNYYNMPFTSNHYYHSKIGDIIISPVSSALEVQIDSVVFNNANISVTPSAYLRYICQANDTIFHLITFNQNNQLIDIVIEYFSGIGTYELGSETHGIAYYRTMSGCIVFELTTSQHPYAGFISINEFDLGNKRCSGTFNFMMDSHLFINGNFNIPIYN